MTYTEKIDVLELLIKILQDHEKKLDEYVTRMEEVLKIVETRTYAPPNCPKCGKPVDVRDAKVDGKDVYHNSCWHWRRK